MRDDVSCFDFGEGRREQKYGYRMSATILLLGGGVLIPYGVSAR